MDIMMPGKSDMEWLREIVQGKIALVVMLTGFGSEDIAVQSIHNGVIFQKTTTQRTGYGVLYG